MIKFLRLNHLNWYLAIFHAKKNPQYHTVWAIAEVNTDFMFILVNSIYFTSKMKNLLLKKIPSILAFIKVDSITPINKAYCNCILHQEIQFRY